MFSALCFNNDGPLKERREVMSKKLDAAKSNGAKAGKKTGGKRISKKEIEEANKLLYRAWKKTYENRQNRLD